ncbi:MAG: tetratricopeptide repeat protein [Myxococcaceae bacterium]
MNIRLVVLSVLALLVAEGCNSCSGEDTSPVDPKQKAEGLYIVATAQYLQGEFDKALDLLNQSKALNPDDPRLPAAYGEIYLSQGKLNEALAQFETATAKDPKRSTNWSRLGYIQAQLGKREEARSSVRKALALFPQDFNALEQLAELELKDGNRDDAVKHLIMAGEAAPDLNKKDLFLRAADILVKSNREPDAALMLKNAVTKDPKLSGEVFARLGELDALEGDLEGALAAYLVAAKRLTHDPVPWEIVGEIYMHKDKPGDAEAAWRESLRIEDRAIVHVQLARLHLKRKENDAANEELDAALKAAKGDDTHETVELADLLTEMNRKPDALKLLGVVAGEEENLTDSSLQLKTARLAKELKDSAAMATACSRVLDAGIKKCP